MAAWPATAHWCHSQGVEVHLVLEPRPVHVEPGLGVLARCRYPAHVFGGVVVFESRMQ